MKETKQDKWERGRTLLLESLHKPDDRLRGCAHNQECYHELMEIREDVIEIARSMKNPYIPAGNYQGGERVKAINGISVVLLGGALGSHYMKDWSEEHKKEWEDWIGNNT